MAKKESPSHTNSLVIVESPAKARTIGKFLGRGFTIEASIGHIRDLPNGAKEVPESLKQEDWAYLGVNVNKDFDPVYIIPPKKAQQVRKLKAALKGATDLYLATDEDREGEAISWHLCEVLEPQNSGPSPGVPRNHGRGDPRRAEASRGRSTRPWSAPRKCGGSSTDCTDTTFRLCCGGKSGRGFRPDGCRAWRCG